MTPNSTIDMIAVEAEARRLRAQATRHALHWLAQWLHLPVGTAAARSA